ncbi:MAG: hypothetical protein IJB19_07940 [Clostridia bacterium]|nr:hypothetical protein [Clostridia bacterium]
MAIHLITVSALILAVLLVRAAFRKKVPARLIYALWLVVAVKLCMPFSLFAVELPSMAEVPQEVPQTEQTVMQTQDMPTVTKASEATILAPITPITPIVPQQPTVSQPIGTKPSEPIVPTVTEPAAIEPIETEVAIPEVPTAAETTPIDWVHIAKVVWFVGSAVMAVWFAATGTVFQQKLRVDRRLHTTVGRTKVYVSKSAGAPCLAGLIPAIYLTPAAANSPSERFVITHEYTHLRHGDHIWSALRTAALIVYWWNPLVWAAAMVSKQDAELACDESVAAKLDDSQRLAYAHTILDTIPQKHAHAVGLGSAPIKERILMLTKRHKNRVVAAILAVALTLSAVGCSFIGPRETTEPVDDTPDLPSSITTAQTTDVPTVTTDNSIENVPTEQQEPVRVLSNEGNLHIHTVMLPLENEDMRFYDVSSTTHSTRYRMFLEYDSSTGKPYQYRRLYVVDALNGEIADCFDLDIQAGVPRITYTDNGGVIYAPITDPVTGTLRSYYMLTVTEKNGEFSLQKTEMQADASLVTSRFVSPDGRYVAYQTEETNGDYGGIYLQGSDGSSQCICENKTAADVESAEVRFYSLTGFADDKHLVYSIHGDLQKVSGIGNGQLPIGYGIYNTETGERTEVHNGKVPIGICDGILYLGVYSDMVPQEIWRAGIDGEEELIASRNAADGVFAMSEDRLFSWDHSMWHRYFPAENAAANTTQVEFYSPDFDQKLAEVSYWKTDTIRSNTMVRFLICEDSVTFVVPYVVEETAQSTVKVLSNAGNLDIRTTLLPLQSARMDYLRFAYDDRYFIYVTQKKNQYADLYILDSHNGEFVYSYALDVSADAFYITYTDEGCIVYGKHENTVTCAYAVTDTDGVFSVIPTTVAAYPIFDTRFVSPDGQYIAYETRDDADRHGGIDIRHPDGRTERIFENIVLNNEFAGGIAGFDDMTEYKLIGFADATHLLYWICGWGYTKGYGIYDVVTGEKEEVPEKGYLPEAVYNGVMYGTVRSNTLEVCSYETLWKKTQDGEYTVLASHDAADGVPLVSENSFCEFKGGIWIHHELVTSGEYASRQEDGQYNAVILRSSDFDTVLAEIDTKELDRFYSDITVYGNLVTFVVPYVKEETAQSTVKVLSNAGNLDIHAVLLPLESEDMRYLAFAYDDRYSIYLTRNGQHYADLYMIDAKNGEIVYTYALDVNAYYFYIAYTDAGCIVYGKDYDTVSCAYTVTDTDGVFSVTPIRMEAYPIAEQRVVSPSGTYIAYKTVDDAGADGGIDIRYPDGSIRRILENTMLEETDDLSGVTGYHPIGFVSDTALVYRIGGWEGTKGYGIYDVTTGEKTEVIARGDSPCAVYDGAFYVEEWGNSMAVYEPQAIWKVTADGAKTKIASKDAADGVYVLSDDKYREFEHSMWCIFDTGNAAGIGYGEDTPENLTVALYSPDLDQKLAEIEYPHNYNAFDNVIAYENSVTVVVPTVSAVPEEDAAITTLADWNQLNYDGAFPADGNCYALINGLVHFGGGADLSERYAEFETVTIGEYAISRKKDEKFLYFDFTVTASGLDTLPIGNYKTTVASFAGPQSDDAEMEILECDAKGRLQSVATDRASNRYLSIWFLAELAWDMGDYGTYDTSASDGFPDNYLAHCEGGRYSLAELNALVKDTFGVEIAADSWFAHDTDDNGDIVLTPGFGGFAFFYDIVDLQIGEDADLITVQHYTDINKLIKSVKVAYRVSNTGRVYGCELIEDAKYAPFGALYARYKYKGWEPMQ